MSIPAPIRRKLGLEKSKKALVSEHEGKIVIEPVTDLLELRGIFKTDKKIPFRKIREAFGEYLAKEAVKGMK